MGNLTRRIDPADAIQAAAQDGLRLAAEHVLGVAVQRVPIEEDTLQNTGATSVGDLEANVTFDGPYAIRQHEELTWHHDPGRQAKYLESAALDEQSTVAALQARAAREALGG